MLAEIDWINFGALIVAALALGLTLYEGSATRRHNRLSVRPDLTFRRSLDAKSASNVSYSVYMRNSGLGPAKITDFKLQFKGKPIPRDYDSLSKLIQRQFKDQPKVRLSACLLLRETIMLPNDEEVLLTVSLDERLTGERKITFEPSLRPFGAYVEYESLYGEKEKVVKDSLVSM